jgi:hypothetical protein
LDHGDGERDVATAVEGSEITGISVSVEQARHAGVRSPEHRAVQVAKRTAVWDCAPGGATRTAGAASTQSERN